MKMMVADRGTGEPISLDAALMAGKKVGPDVTRLLEEDHRNVIGWFLWYVQAPDAKTKQAVARRICKALRAHMAAEEEIFYPEAERETGDTSLVRRAFEEHREGKRLMDRIEGSRRADETQAELVRQLHDEIEAHVDGEETELFPEVRESGMDLFAVGEAVAARRVDCLFELSGGNGAAAAPTGRSGRATNARQPREFPAMQISQEQARHYFVVGLKNAHATAKEGRTAVKSQVDRLEQYPKLKQKLSSHLGEKDAQLARLEDILRDVGERPSAVKDTAMTLMARAASAASRAAEDEVIKSCLAMVALAKIEAAAYETLILFGEAAGQNAALRPLQKCLSEERGMAAFIEENLRPTGMRFLQLESERAQASR